MGIGEKSSTGGEPSTGQDWRTSPTAPCGCAWDGWHCPHCGSVTDHSGDAWEPAHTLGCHTGAQARADHAARAAGQDQASVEPVDDNF